MVAIRTYIHTYPGIMGQAGTIFFDNDLSTQLSANKVTRTAIDRYSIVVMGGIAAEALQYDKAEGGASDEETLVRFLVGLVPPWDQKRVLNQVCMRVCMYVCVCVCVRMYMLCHV